MSRHIERNVRHYIGKRGYVLVKEHWSESILQQCREDCKVRPFTPVDFGEPPAKFPIYRECANKIYLPKFYGLEKFGEPDEVRIPPGDNIDLNFAGQLRGHQTEPAEIVMRALREKGGGILSLFCGAGKTTLACYFMSQLRKKTFVLVHKEFLMNQWIERIGAFLPGARIGKVQGSKIDIEDKDVVIGMVQSIALKEYPLHVFDSFGFLILDEAHRVPSKEFSKSLTKIQCQHMLALSATPHRQDGLTKVLKWFIGDVVYEKKSKMTTQSTVRRVFFQSQNPNYDNEIVGPYGMVNRAAMINHLADYVPRMRAIATNLQQLVQEEGRQVLLLSDRKELLKDLEIAMTNREISVGYYVGGMKPDQLAESATKQVILATYPMAAEGLDIATIDTICLATPKTQVEQAVGRIRAQTMGANDMRKSPLVIDWVDDFSVFANQARQRKQFYKKKGYVIEKQVWDENSGPQEIIQEFGGKVEEQAPVKAPVAMYTMDDLM